MGDADSDLVTNFLECRQEFNLLFSRYLLQVDELAISSNILLMTETNSDLLKQ